MGGNSKDGVRTIAAGALASTRAEIATGNVGYLREKVKDVNFIPMLMDQAKAAGLDPFRVRIEVDKRLKNDFLEDRLSPKHVEALTTAQVREMLQDRHNDVVREMLQQKENPQPDVPNR